jgi:uncharacterized protein (TIGR02145 family)
MKKVFKLLVLAFFTACMNTFFGCNKDVEFPILTTTSVSVISATAVVAGGNVVSSGGVEVTARGVCWSTDPYPSVAGNKTEDGTGSGEFSSNITGLTPNITYYLRAYAINSAGTAYGDVLSFTTSGISSILFNPYLTYGSVTDIDGNVYKTIQIGSQGWMAENLKTTKYNDDTPIQNVTDNTKWLNLRSDAYCWYNNDASEFKAIYGALYNWEAVNTGKLCPTGWHVPSTDEWKILETYLGGEELAGGKLKETGTTHWLSPNTGATNSSGFTALPGGLRDISSDFFSSYIWINSYGIWWSSTPEIETTDNSLWLDFNSGKFSSAQYYSGLSVRCVKDN